MQSKIDALISWPESTDYPLFHLTLPKLTQFVQPTVCITGQGDTPVMGDILVGMTQHGCRLLRGNKLSSDVYPGDWRNAAVNYMIDSSHNEWILSLEQDFFIKDYEKFFATIEQAMGAHDVIGFEEGNRYHPAFLLVKRSAVNKTKRNFSAGEVGFDHFAHFSAELKQVAPAFISLEELGLLPGRDWWHMRGLTDNYFAAKPYYNLPEFMAYNEVCLQQYDQRQMISSEIWHQKVVNAHQMCIDTNQTIDKTFQGFLEKML
jgi:hypothetical protein